ncbi:unnamed protein product [Paramecium octaurelia]|uniref:Uncharacterized protein n=1 Tax=Paramecium octaurelia TaxID=43137 RepID=A0A8S1YR64_PAROT|nr:unnamed protein product [Paramecium octaurelia]
MVNMKSANERSQGGRRKGQENECFKQLKSRRRSMK